MAKTTTVTASRTTVRPTTGATEPAAEPTPVDNTTEDKAAPPPTVTQADIDKAKAQGVTKVGGATQAANEEAATAVPRAVATAKTIPNLMEVFYTKADSDAYHNLVSALAGKTDPKTKGLWKVMWAVSVPAVGTYAKKQDYLQGKGTKEHALVCVAEGNYLVEAEGFTLEDVYPTTGVLLEALRQHGRL